MISVIDLINTSRHDFSSMVRSRSRSQVLFVDMFIVLISAVVAGSNNAI